MNNLNKFNLLLLSSLISASCLAQSTDVEDKNKYLKNYTYWDNSYLLTPNFNILNKDFNQINYLSLVDRISGNYLYYRMDTVEAGQANYSYNGFSEPNISRMHKFLPTLAYSAISVHNIPDIRNYLDYLNTNTALIGGHINLSTNRYDIASYAKVEVGEKEINLQTNLNSEVEFEEGYLINNLAFSLGSYKFKELAKEDQNYFFADSINYYGRFTLASFSLNYNYNKANAEVPGYDISLANNETFTSSNYDYNFHSIGGFKNTSKSLLLTGILKHNFNNGLSISAKTNYTRQDNKLYALDHIYSADEIQHKLDIEKFDYISNSFANNFELNYIKLAHEEDNDIADMQYELTLGASTLNHKADKTNVAQTSVDFSPLDKTTYPNKVDLVVDPDLDEKDFTYNTQSVYASAAVQGNNLNAKGTVSYKLHKNLKAPAFDLNLGFTSAYINAFVNYNQNAYFYGRFENIVTTKRYSLNFNTGYEFDGGLHLHGSLYYATQQFNIVRANKVDPFAPEYHGANIDLYTDLGKGLSFKLGYNYLSKLNFDIDGQDKVEQSENGLLLWTASAKHSVSTIFTYNFNDYNNYSDNATFIDYGNLTLGLKYISARDLKYRDMDATSTTEIKFKNYKLDSFVNLDVYYTFPTLKSLKNLEISLAVENLANNRNLANCDITVLSTKCYFAPERKILLKTEYKF